MSVSSVRRAWKGVVVALVAATLGLPLETAGPVHAAPASVGAGGAARQPVGPADTLPPGEQWTVTLLTGERVGVRSDDEGRVTARIEGGAPASTIQEPDGDIYVLPDSALDLLDGRLDRELFNVVGLVDQGYDDESSDVLPVIAQHVPDAGGTAARSAAADGEAPQALPSIDAVAVEVSRAEPDAARQLLDRLDAAPERRGAPPRIWLDRKIETTAVAELAVATAPSGPGAARQAPGLDANLTQIGADRAWAAGFEGEGVRVAVLDTGIDPDHPDLAGKVVAQENFSESADMVDRYGHGTHVAATVAGTGAAAGGARRGVAPEADLVIGKVLDDSGSGFISDIITGMEWAAPQSDVINMSLGGNFASDGTDPFSQALNAISAENDTLFVVSAGNSGPASTTMSSPAAADLALTVGAVDTDDELAEFSSRGPVIDTYALKPEIVAPGVDVVAARAANTLMGDPQSALYTAASGTSMASPHVAGAAALLAGAHPDWTAQQLKDGLIGSTDDIGADGYDAGAGRLDIGTGVTAPLRPDQDVVELAVPHPRQGVHEQELSWTNTGDAPLTVDLAAELSDRVGAPVGGSAATVTPSQLTIAPGATGTATLSVDGDALDDGLFSGAVVASVDGDPVARTPVAVRAASATANLTIEATSPVAGDPVFVAFISNLDDYAYFNTWDVFRGESVTLEVPEGRYSILGSVGNIGFGDAVRAVQAEPELVVDGDTTVTFDGAAAETFAPRLAGVTDPLVISSVGVSLASYPEAGTGGLGVVYSVDTTMPYATLRMAELEGDPDLFRTLEVFRLQSPPLTVQVGDSEPMLDVGVVHGTGFERTEATTTLEAVDVGDGSDLSGVDGKVAIARIPGIGATGELTQRALDAGAAMVLFVDEDGTQPVPVDFFPFAELPILAAGGSSASALIAAGQAGDTVTFTVAPSPVVWDVQRPDRARLDPAPVLSRRDQRRMARIDERFHHDPDGTGPFYDARNAFVETVGYLPSAGPLPERRTSYVTPGVVWQSAAAGRYLGEFFPGYVDEFVAQLSMDKGVTYDAGSRQSLTWLRRGQWPGLVDTTYDDLFCPALPSLRTSDNMFVWVVPFQDGLDRVTCAEGLDETLTLRQDGQVVGTEAYNSASFAVEPGTSDFVLEYQQHGKAPYEHQSTTRWSFRSGEPEGGDALLPLLTVGYRLPLGLDNQPNGRTATLTARHMVDGSQVRITTMKVWTSTDHGATWTAARVTRQSPRRFDVRLPRVADGTPVSLKIDATDRHGSRIEQTLVDTYTG